MVKLLSAMVLLLIFLPLTLSLALTLDSVQSFLVGRVTAALTQKVGSEISVGRIHYTVPRDFTLDKLLVEDQGGDTLIYSENTRLRLSLFSLKSNQLTLSEVEAYDCEFHLREMPDSVMNIKQFVDSLSNPNGKGNFRMEISSMALHNFDFSLERLKSADRGYGVDLSDILIEGVEAKASDFLSFEKVTTLNIVDFSGVEKSGFEITSGDGSLRIVDGELDVTDLHLATPYSAMSLPKFRLHSASWQDYKDFNANVELYIESDKSRVAVSDVAYFAPSLATRTFVASELSGVVTGTVDRMAVEVDRLIFGPSARAEASFTIAGASQIETAIFNFKNISVEATRDDVDIFLIGFGGEPLGVAASKIAESMDRVKVSGTGKGQVDDMMVDLALSSKRGEASYKGEVKNITTQIAVNGSATTTNLDLGAMLSNRSLGQLTMSSSLRYAPTQWGVDSRIDGHVAALGYNSYSYSDIDLEATYDGQNIESVVNSHDPNLDFDLSALIHLGTRNHYDVTMRVERANLNALKINERDSISELSGSVRVNLEGSELDDMNGSLTLRNMSYQYNDQELYAPVITASARNTDESKFLGLESDYIDITFNSQSSYEALIAYLKEGLNKYIPFLYADHSERKRNKQVTIANNYSTLKIDFKRFGEVANAISSGFNVADNSSVNFMVNPYAERFSLRLKSDYIENNKLAATQINLNASNDNDSLSLYATASDVFAGQRSFSTYTLMAGARNNVVELSTGFRDTANSASATLGLRGTFDGTSSVDIAILPSQLSMDGEQWMISSREIVGSRERWKIDGFTVENGSQRLTLNGVASKSASDSLVLKLNNYDISMITSVVGDLGYSIDGVSNGYVNVTQLLSSPRFVADVKLDSVEVNSIPAPPLLLSAGWDTEQNRARVVVENRRLGETVATGYYAPSTQRYYANLKADSLNMALVEPFLKTTISGTRGYADVDVLLRGEGRKASLSGTINAYDLSTKILYTQVEYFVPSALVTVEDNRLSTYAREMFDEDGNRGLVTFNLSLDHLSNVSYSMRIVPENMLVLNTTLQDNELFYGKLYATGVATLVGDKRGMNMDITATSEANSSFYMPLMTQSTVASTDFITFVQDRKEVGESSKSNFRRDYINERARRTSQAASLNINMALHATPDLDFQLVIDPVVGDIIKARGEGRFNLNIAPQDNIFEMYGDYSITEGSYLFTLLNPISKRFTVDSGSSIQWTGDAIDPILDIDAVYKVKTSLDPLINSTSSYSSESSSRAVPVDCIIHLGDRLAQPSVEFSIEVPTADTEQQAVIANTLIDQDTISQQFFYLMFANSFISVNSSYGNGLASSSTASSTGFELLTNQLSNWLSSSNYNVVIRYRPESDLTSDEVDVGFSRGLIDNRLLIEVEGNYLADTDLYGSGYSNFMGEAYVTWLIDKAGTFRLKGFTQTIDRYDENQGLQETGIGLYYSESFNTFSELKQKIKNRFKRKPKEEEEDEEEENENDKIDKN
ncbi:MAG: translocation/assembly module TamB domain-containing protein [Rikenellaceae bacterium]